jgi:hypothetical protein
MNSKWIEGSREKCYVRVYGIDGETAKPLIAHARGDIEYHLDDGFKNSLILKNCLYVPEADIYGEGQAAVLISTKQLARGGVGVHFLPGGEQVQFTGAEGEVLGGFHSKGPLYTHTLGHVDRLIERILHSVEKESTDRARE